MSDTNVNLYRWPFRRLAGDDPADLVARLRKKGVTQAWAGSFEGLPLRKRFRKSLLNGERGRLREYIIFCSREPKILWSVDRPAVGELATRSDCYGSHWADPFSFHGE